MEHVLDRAWMGGEDLFQILDGLFRLLLCQEQFGIGTQSQFVVDVLGQQFVQRALRKDILLFDNIEFDQIDSRRFEPLVGIERLFEQVARPCIFILGNQNHCLQVDGEQIVWLTLEDVFRHRPCGVEFAVVEVQEGEEHGSAGTLSRGDFDQAPHGLDREIGASAPTLCQSQLADQLGAGGRQ